MTDFLPYHALVTAPSASPSRWMFMLHGILGSGANLRTFARRLAERRPAWGFVLVDLRAHGQSQNAPPPHGVGSAADDLVRLGQSLSLDVRGILGHSFGGKVALAYLGKRPGEVDRAFVLDASPAARAAGERPDGTEAVLRMLEGMPQPLPSRERFLEIVAEHGYPKSIAEWLAMNVRRAPDGFRLRVDLGAIRQMLDDYFTVDLFPLVETPNIAGELCFVLGGRSDALASSERARLEAIAARSSHVSVHVLPNAGHWVHVDDPEGLFAVVIERLSR